MWAAARSALGALGGCAVAATESDEWPSRLQGDTVALLGEVHDNDNLHRLRTAALQRAFDQGWGPTIVMEQFDLDRQDDIERSRRERPRDVKHLIASAAPTSDGWAWHDYETVIALALEHGLPLRAGNLPRAQATRIVREGYAAVLGSRQAAELDAADAAWQTAQQREIDAGHCGALPRALLPGMARAQFARDAAMAQVVRDHSAKGVVLLAGNGHVRRDLGVPRWLDLHEDSRLLVVGFVETGDTVPPGAFDAVVSAAAAKRRDPCSAFAAPKR